MTPSQQPSGAALYLRLFLRMGVPFGLTMGVIAWLNASFRTNAADAVLPALVVGLAAGALFGLLMSAILGTTALWTTRHKGPGALEVHQGRVIPMRGDRQEVMQRVVGALAGLPRAGTPTLDETGGVVEVRLGWSWKSFGEIVTARVETDPTGTHHVHVESRPKAKTTLVDYGAGSENADAVAKALEPTA